MITDPEPPLVPEDWDEVRGKWQGRDERTYTPSRENRDKVVPAPEHIESPSRSRRRR